MQLSTVQNVLRFWWPGMATVTTASQSLSLWIRGLEDEAAGKSSSQHRFYSRHDRHWANDSNFDPWKTINPCSCYALIPNLRLSMASAAESNLSSPFLSSVKDLTTSSRCCRLFWQIRAFFALSLVTFLLCLIYWKPFFRPRITDHNRQFWRYNILKLGTKGLLI